MRKPFRGPWEPLQSDYFDGGTTCDISFGTANAAFNTDIAMTILALFRYDGDNNAGSGAPEYIYSKSDSGGNGMRLVISGAPKKFTFALSSSGGGGGANPGVTASIGPSEGSWYHFAGSSVGGSIVASGNINVYIGANGSALKVDNNTATDGVTALVTNAAHNMHIGEREASNNRSVKGPIAYVIRWPRVLSLGELLMRQRTAPYDVGDAIFNYYNGYDHGPYRLPATKAGLFRGQLPGFTMGPYARRSTGAAPPSGGAAGYAGFVAG